MKLGQPQFGKNEKAANHRSDFYRLPCKHETCRGLCTHSGNTTGRSVALATFLGFAYVFGKVIGCFIFGMASIMYTGSLLAGLWLRQETNREARIAN